VLKRYKLYISMEIENKRILIVGGTGSLGYTLNKRYIDKNKVYNMSRDESKHWKMRLTFGNHPNQAFIIGNVADSVSVSNIILRVDPHIIIIAAAMKHIDQCETNTYESIRTNLLGTQNVLSVESPSLETVLFVSSDKACSPVNNYGMCKAMSETLLCEKAHYNSRVKFVCVRYGNVLNSNGSIIPLLHDIGKDRDAFTITDDRMTRFIMTLEQSVDLIHHTLLYGENGDIVIPKLKSMKIRDVIEIFSEKYGKPIVKIDIRPGEKIHESLINETQSMRTIDTGKYYVIKSPISYKIVGKSISFDYNSSSSHISKEDLAQYLTDLGLF